MDHGCDSLTLGLGALVSATVVQGGVWSPLYFLSFGFIAFYLAHWEEYFNHYLDIGILGPTEAEMSAIGIFLATYFLGPSFWTSTQVSIFGYFSLNVLEILMYFSTINGIVVTLASIYSGLSLASKRGISPFTALSQLIPFSISYASIVIWIYNSQTLYTKHAHLFVLISSFLFSYLVINCIVQRMCDLPYRYFYFIMTFVIIGAVHSIYKVKFNNGVPLVNEELMLQVFCAIYFLVFIHFALEVINGLCKHLKIKALTIPYKKKD